MSADKNFLVIQPGCDMSAADVFLVWDSPQCAARKYLTDRGVDEEFIRDAQVGDAQFFDKERVVLRIGRVFDGENWT